MTIDVKVLDAMHSAAVRQALQFFADLDALIERYVESFPEDQRAEARLRAVAMTVEELSRKPAPEKTP